MLLDVDGVLTDGTVALLPNSELVRTLHNKDSYIIQLAVKKGLKVGIITGGSSETVKERLEGLGVQDVFLKSYNKIKVYEDYLKKYSLTDEDVLYVGDDLPDYEVMKRVALACCPADAAHEIKEICHHISYNNGGKGAVRDILEQLLKAQGLWMDKDGFSW